MSDELPAGRELDALVAEKVMGWRWYVFTIAASGENVRAIFPPDDTAPVRFGYLPWKRGDHDWRIANGGYPPAFSTDIAAAWEVVAEMEKRGQWCQVERCRRVGWCVTFAADPGAHCSPAYEDEGIIDCASTVPLSICRAALKVLSVPAPQSTAP